MHDVLGLQVTCNCNTGMQRQEHLPGFRVIDIQVPWESLPVSTIEKVERNEKATQPELVAFIYICIYSCTQVCMHRRKIICNIIFNSLLLVVSILTHLCFLIRCLHSMWTVSAPDPLGSMARALRSSSLLIPAFPLDLCLLIHLYGLAFFSGWLCST